MTSHQNPTLSHILMREEKRWSRLQFEGVQLNNDDINNQHEEWELRRKYFEKTTTEEGTDKKESKDEEL